MPIANMERRKLILSMLERGPTITPVLADAIGLSLAAANHHLNYMVKQGFIFRSGKVKTEFDQMAYVWHLAGTGYDISTPPITERMTKQVVQVSIEGKQNPFSYLIEAAR